MKKFIEISFPVKEVSIESAREKNIRHGHISTLHVWWARRPLASSRATNYASLIPAPETIDEWNKKRQFIIDFSKWENSLDPILIDKAIEDIMRANGGKPPRVLDPFGGGGSIPLEALRLGCETYSNDLNPVAILIQKCILEYPQKYGKRKEHLEGWGELSDYSSKNALIEDVKKWSNWVLIESRNEIEKFYPKETDGSIIIGYIWTRTIPCQNPSCGAEIPLIRQFWLAKKDKKKVALFPYIEGEEVKFRIVGDGYDKMPDGFNPDKGTISKAVATCQICGSVVDAKTTRKLFQDGKSGQEIVAAVMQKPGMIGKKYRIVAQKDIEIFKAADEYLRDKREKLQLEWVMDPVPDENLIKTGGNQMAVLHYGMYKFGDLFNARQKLAMITFVEKVRKVHTKMLEEKYEAEYAKAVVSYLALGLDMTSAFTNTLARWENTSEAIKQLFSRQALSMLWDYVEVNPFSTSSGSFETGWEYYLKVMQHCAGSSSTSATVSQSSATSLLYQDNFFDAVFTDPPYYDNVYYSNLSDFFYVWLKRTIGELYPEIFSTPLTPKSNEIVADPIRHTIKKEAKDFFESMLKRSFQEIHRVLKPDGIATIVYAHKSTEGWETLINSLLDSGLIVTGAWPLNTEMGTRLNSQESASLASSIYIVARKMKRQPTGFYKQVKDEMKLHLNEKLHRLWEEGVSGADFFIAAIGSAIEVFGKYEKVMDDEGNIVRADRLLCDVRRIATDYAVHQILHNGFAGEISDLTRFYVLYRWNYGEAKVQFDEARKLAQSCSIDLANEWSRHGFIKKDKEFMSVLGPQDRKIEDFKNSSEMIDVLHSVLLFWEKSKRDEMVSLLQESGYGKGEAFYRVAQGVSETLPIESKEKKLLDGFLAGRERLREEIRKEVVQTRLGE
jgi:putative DNA methylase